MDNKPKQSNKIIWLLAATVAFVGYYFYSTNESSTLQLGDSAVTPEVQANAELFLARLSILSAISLETEVFDNKVFQSYQAFTLPLPEQNVGRTNPFLTADGSDVRPIE